MMKARPYRPEEAKRLARGWVKEFVDQGGIPKREFEIGYSRSSGPGGQHVNKTNTKATVRLPVNCRWIPEWAKSDLRKHINAQIESAASSAIPKPPDVEKLKRIAKHEATFGRAQKEIKQRSVSTFFNSQIDNTSFVPYRKRSSKVEPKSGLSKDVSVIYWLYTRRALLYIRSDKT
ncbi:RF-1 domain-containing protein [Rhizoctonia solani AG-1 IA]|uniref:RF-1 domain-containing protein n=1 Tax=Thanatephorus cucumeris (strain AG1-IA) TaxID=983506 RepID=L8WMF1_THACA|nr:RF-1 domain-containing protein [Rhizoctonia solani AG-1 IA]